MVERKEKLWKSKWFWKSTTSSNLSKKLLANKTFTRHYFNGNQLVTMTYNEVTLTMAFHLKLFTQYKIKNTKISYVAS